MNPIKNMRLLVLALCLLLLATATCGLLSQQEATTRLASTIDGRTIELYGRGAYAHHSILRAATYLGTDWAVLLLVVPLLLLTVSRMGKSPQSLLLCSGALMIAFYYSISLAFGAAFNRYFLLYTLLFAVAGFTLGHALYLLHQTTWKPTKQTAGSNTGTAIFLFMAGASALIWLSLIIPALASGDFSQFIDINTTEPTFVLDMGIVFPFFTVCGVALLKQKEFSYRFTPVLLTFYTLVGAMVVMQTCVQLRLGLEIPLPQLFGMVVSFVALGALALWLNVRFLRKNLTG